MRHAQDEADSLLAGHPQSGGIERLLTAVARMRTDRPDDLAVVSCDLDAVVGFVRHALTEGATRSQHLRTAVTALAYLRNPYDHVFDLQVEGGFEDDIAVLREASAALGSRP